MLTEANSNQCQIHPNHYVHDGIFTLFYFSFTFYFILTTLLDI